MSASSSSSASEGGEEEQTEKYSDENVKAVLSKDSISVPHYSDLKWRLEVPVCFLYFPHNFL